MRGHKVFLYVGESLHFQFINNLSGAQYLCAHNLFYMCLEQIDRYISEYIKCGSAVHKKGLSPGTVSRHRSVGNSTSYSASYLTYGKSLPGSRNTELMEEMTKGVKCRSWSDVLNNSLYFSAAHTDIFLDIFSPV